jgi:hypothetical protein
MRPSDSLVSFGHRSGLPSRMAYRRTGASSSPLDSRTCPRAERRRAFTGSPSHRFLLRRNEGLPGCWAVLFVRAVVEDPAGCDTPSPFDGEVAIAFRYFETLSIRDGIAFVAAWPTAHTLACLRFAEHVTALVARLTTGQAGSPLAGRVSHPLDDSRSFMESSHTPILLDQYFLVAPKLLSAKEHAQPI